MTLMTVYLRGVHADALVRDAREVRGVRVDAERGGGVAAAQLAHQLHRARVLALELLHVEHVPGYYYPRTALFGVVL